MTPWFPAATTQRAPRPLAYLNAASSCDRPAEEPLTSDVQHTGASIDAVVDGGRELLWRRARLIAGVLVEDRTGQCGTARRNREGPRGTLADQHAGDERAMAAGRALRVEAPGRGSRSEALDGAVTKAGDAAGDGAVDDADDDVRAPLGQRHDRRKAHKPQRIR
jgi:hypothetical protein